MDYLEEIKKLPLDIQDILISDFGAQINREIIADYALSPEQTGSFIDLVNDVYLKLISINTLSEEVSKRINLSPQKSNDLAIDIAGKKLLLVDDYFSGKVFVYLKQKGVILSKFALVVANELNAIEEEKEASLPEDSEEAVFNDALLDSEEDEEFISRSKQDSLDLFKNDLDKILSLGSEFNEIIGDYNEDLLEFLQEENFAGKLESILYNNKNIITHIKPIIDNNTRPATVSNWLKDFIAFYGSSNFNTIVLAQYLVNSPSAKRLSVIEKRKIKRLLNIYRNIVFFSERIKDGLRELAIIPLELMKVKEDEIGKIKKEESSVKDAVVSKKEEKKSTPIINKDGADNSTEDGGATFNEEAESPELSKTSSLVNELEKMLQDYTEGTLEYKTILQEIKRLKSSK